MTSKMHLNFSYLPVSCCEGFLSLKKKNKNKRENYCVKKYHLFFSEHAVFLVSYDASNKQEGKKMVIKEHLILYKY